VKPQDLTPTPTPDRREPGIKWLALAYGVFLLAGLALWVLLR
jgi:hypothetical protein